MKVIQEAGRLTARVDGNSSLKWREYNTSASNFVFDATDADKNLYMETDNYREGACQIWTDNVAYTDYSGQGP